MSVARIIASAEWEQHKASISNLYLDERKCLEEVMRSMQENHGFYARSATMHTCSVSEGSSNLQQQGSVHTKVKTLGHLKEHYRRQLEICGPPHPETKYGRERKRSFYRRQASPERESEKGDVETSHRRQLSA